MFYLGIYRHESVIAFLDLVPAISPTIIQRVGTELQSLPVNSIFSGAFRGMPYKVYAVQSGHIDMSLLMFLSLIPARLIRFFFVTAVTALIAKTLLKSLSNKIKAYLHLTLWTAIYIAFFILVK